MVFFEVFGVVFENVVKYLGVMVVEVELVYLFGMVIVMVMDEGVGFDFVMVFVDCFGICVFIDV